MLDSTRSAMGSRLLADWLAAPQRLQGQRADLQALRGQPGAVEALAEEVRQLLPRQLGSA